MLIFSSAQMCDDLIRAVRRFRYYSYGDKTVHEIRAALYEVFQNYLSRDDGIPVLRLPPRHAPVGTDVLRFIPHIEVGNSWSGLSNSSIVVPSMFIHVRFFWTWSSELPESDEIVLGRVEA